MTFPQIAIILLLVGSFIKSMILAFVRAMNADCDGGELLLGMLVVFIYNVVVIGAFVSVLVLGGFFR